VPFKYTGRRLDPETGLYYYRARYYSASLGRFLQADPIGYGDDMNMYAYVGGDPVNATDPSGMKCVSVWRYALCVVSDGKQTKVYGTTAEQAADPINTRPAGSDINKKDKPGEGAGVFGSSRGGGRRTHKGTDYQGIVGDAILAAGDGVVIRADGKDVNGYGNQVVIAHGGNNEDLFTQSAHLDTINVEVGDVVRAGDMIGTMGRSGNTPEQGDTHVHVELREGPSSRAPVRDIEPELPP
jgi:RHS repeat-associated protein